MLDKILQIAPQEIIKYTSKLCFRVTKNKPLQCGFKPLYLVEIILCLIHAVKSCKTILFGYSKHLFTNTVIEFGSMLRCAYSGWSAGAGGKHYRSCMGEANGAYMYNHADGSLMVIWCVFTLVTPPWIPRGWIPTGIYMEFRWYLHEGSPISWRFQE